MKEKNHLVKLIEEDGNLQVSKKFNLHEELRRLMIDKYISIINKQQKEIDRLTKVVII